jgi:hypothetical protein
MKERPILFSGEMVRALMAGRKTQTRRVVKPQPPIGHAWSGWCVTSTHRADEGKATWAAGTGPFLRDVHRVACPYGKPGDRLVVRETFYAYGRWETRFDRRKGRDAWHFVDMTIESGKQYRYAADSGDNGTPERGKGGVVRWWKRPAIFMPRTASRLTLEITGVRVERLQDISEADAQAEGIERVGGEFSCSPWRNYRIGKPGEMSCHCSAKARSYMTLWESINGPSSWDANPFVWVMEFRRIDQTEGGGNAG